MTQVPQYHTFNDFSENIQLPGIVVPQAVYQAPQPFQRRPTVRFAVNNRPGVRLADALANNFNGLQGAATTPMITDANRISCRILWPGYEQWNDGIHVVDNNAQPYNLARLAYIISRTVQRFLTDIAHVRSTEQRPDWWVSSVPFESLYLVELRHVSTGSWQPVLCRRV